MSIPKYRTEFILSVYACNALLTQQNDLEQTAQSGGFDENSPFHVYMICRRARVTFDPEAFRVSQEEIAGELRIQLGGQFVRHPFVMENGLKSSRARVECLFPYSAATFRDEEERGVRVRAADLAGWNGAWPEHLTLEVLYIGQSYGVEGARTAPQRLLSHSTLQSIYAHEMVNSPDKEVWLLLLNLESQWVSCIDGRREDVITGDAEDAEHVRAVLGHVVTDELEVDLAEAALIRYFQPTYNKRYAETFPSPEHKTYSECYSLGLRGVAVEVSTDGLGARLWSSQVQARWCHSALYPLRSGEEWEALLGLRP